jgi:uncharacterized lipoprotein YbaY
MRAPHQRSLFQLSLGLIVLLLQAEPLTFAQDRWASADARTRGVQQNDVGSKWQGGSWLGGGSVARRQWRLGVEGFETETGVLVRSVTPRSAAQLARIEADDVIIAVEGFQVGIVAGRLYDLNDELNRRANANGVVTLLVQDHISGRLASIRAQLDGNQNSLTGTLIHNGRVPLPSDAIVTVEIENVTRPHYQVRQGNHAFRPTVANNIPFEIAYDPSFIDPQDTYRVRAFVSSGGRTILSTPSPQNVLTRGNPNQARLTLAPVETSLVGGNTTPGVITAGYPNYNTLNERITDMYMQYLGRRPTTLELAALRATPGIESRLDLMPLELMAAQEYFDLAGNNDVVWLQKVFQEIVKKRPSQTELDQWMRRYSDLRFSRTELLRQLNSQVRR